MPHQWDITLQDLPDRGCSWDVVLPCDVMRDSDVGHVEAIDDLCADVPWRGSVCRRGDCYHLTGHWQARIRRRCCRCLEPFDWKVEGDVRRDFQLEDTQEGAADDVLMPPGQLSLVDLLREEIWLTWQGDVACSEQCAGLCSGCGCNLNNESCRCCKADDDHPFAALRQLKLKD